MGKRITGIMPGQYGEKGTWNLITRVAGRGALLLVLLTGLVSCDIVEEEADEQEDGEDFPALTQEDPRTLNEKFGAVADREPGFAGFHLDENGQPVISMAALASDWDSSGVVGALEEVFGDDILERGDSEHRELTSFEPQFEEAAYRMQSLLTWYQGLQRVFEVDQVVYTDLDEAENRLIVGLSSMEASADVEGIIEEEEIPREAVRLVEAALPEEHGHDLQGSFSPIRGGIEHGYNVSGTTWSQCTIGIMVGYDGEVGYLTNSHCTPNRGSISSKSFANPIGGSTIGSEHTDPSYQTCGFFNNSACRQSDAAFIELTGGANAMSAIARPDGWNFGSSGSSTLDIDHGNPTLDIRDAQDHPVSGETVDKIGRTTGWTYGDVNRTCYNTAVNDPNGGRIQVNGNILRYRCQYSANYNSNGGDSGSPVFDWHGGEVTITGLNWGSRGNGDGIFSPWGGILRDF